MHVRSPETRWCTALRANSLRQSSPAPQPPQRAEPQPRPSAARSAARASVRLGRGSKARQAARTRDPVCLAEKFLRVRVEEDGPGVPVEMREEAIKPFVRLYVARS